MINTDTQRTLGRRIIAYCSSAVGIIDTLRRLKKRRKDFADFEAEATKELFSDGLSAFITALRVNLFHGRVVIPGHTMSLAGWESSGSMTLSRDELLFFGKWAKAAARDFIKSSPRSLQLMKIIDEYHQKLLCFEERATKFLRDNVTESEKDYWSIKDEQKAEAAKQWANMMVGMLGKRSPYEYLHYYFSDEQIRATRRLKDQSKEQVDFIIFLKPDIPCDERLRQQLYQVFGVPDQDEPPSDADAPADAPE